MERLVAFYCEQALKDSARVIFHRANAAKWNSGNPTKDAKFRQTMLRWAQDSWNDALRCELRVCMYADRVIRIRSEAYV